VRKERLKNMVGKPPGGNNDGDPAGRPYSKKKETQKTEGHVGAKWGEVDTDGGMSIGE